MDGAYLSGTHARDSRWLDRGSRGTSEQQPTRIGSRGHCTLRVPHAPHTDSTGITDNGGYLVLHECPGQFADCANCDDVKCMDCRLRYVHDTCAHDCPECCPVPSPARSAA